MDGHDLFDCLDFDNHFALDEKIESESLLNFLSSKNHWNGSLPDIADARRIERQAKALLIHRLQQSRTKFSMNRQRDKASPWYAYAPGVTPPDFHAVVEVWLGGSWHLVDATGMAQADEIVRIGVGRDATDIAFMTVFGSATMFEQRVTVTRG